MKPALLVCAVAAWALMVELPAAAPAQLALSTVVSVTAIRNETPVPAPAGGWTLQGYPLNGLSCYRNGLRQNPATDYTLTGNAIASAAWQPTDTLLCDYERLSTGANWL